ncbi:hypothetical protein HDU91_004934 [Kappamyces sp. JEL0680]|nr:hypothetical protein HDU91_004934 [Kappamyces sp. JEL0680]
MELNSYRWRFLPEVAGTKLPILDASSYSKDSYASMFLGKSHLNFLCSESPLGPLAVSLLQDKDCYRVLIRSREGVEQHELPSKELDSWTRRILMKKPSLEDICSALNLNVPCSFLKLCADPGLPTRLVAMEKRLLALRCNIGIVSFDETNLLYTKFLEWVYDVHDEQGVSSVFHFDWNGKTFSFAPAGTHPIIVVFQRDTAEAISIPKDVSCKVVVVVTQEPELDGYGIDVAVRENLAHLINVQLPSPSLFLKTVPDREFILRLLWNLNSALLNTVLYPQLKNARHATLYDLAREHGL